MQNCANCQEMTYALTVMPNTQNGVPSPLGFYSVLLVVEAIGTHPFVPSSYLATCIILVLTANNELGRFEFIAGSICFDLLL